MRSIAEWLGGIGLAQYARVFDENGIDLESVALLTDGDLEKLGLLLGHRRKLLKAIAQVNDAAPPQPAAPPAAVPASSAGERRQLTVMFCDLVGSTQLSEQLDPEDLREVMRAYQQAAARVIERFDGHVAQYLGDGLLVYFGHPHAHEDDAQRAVRAGLGIAEAVRALGQQLIGKTQMPLSVRIGIHTGVVVVGEVGGGARHEQLALGDTPNVAARLQTMAEAGAVVLSERTQQLAGPSFEYRDLGLHSLRGVAEAVRVSRVLQEQRTNSRFDASHAGASTPMVGRDAELSTALRAWREARSGHGQVVLLCGEPGIGKSRLLRAVREAAVPEGAQVWQYQCSPYSSDTALHPIVDHLERALGFEREEALGIRLDKLERFMREYQRPPSEISLVARVLGLPAEQRYGPLGMSPHKQKAETLRALNGLTLVAARSEPVLMLFEDLHWADPTTLELLDGLLPRLKSTPVMLLGTHRPEFQSSWKGKAGVVALTLERLNSQQTAAIASRVAAEKRLPEEIVQQIVSKTDGVPLFVEELTKTILETGLLTDRGGAYVLSGALPALAIPSTLRDSLMSRLDRLAAVKEVAQIGACIGREFGYELLALVSPLKPAELDRALAQLVAAELVYRQGAGSDARLVFKHALVQDTAYDSLLKSRRVQIHALVAQALEDHFQETVRAEPELLARHLTAADLPERAIPYWLSAGRQATTRSANREGIAHLSRGVQLVLAQPASPERDRQELEFRVSLTTPIIAAYGWGAPQFEEAYRQSVSLCDRVNDADLVSRALYMQYGYCTWTARHRIAEEAAQRMVAIGDAQENRVVRLVGHGLLGRVRCYLGSLADGAVQLELSLALADREQDARLALLYGQDPVMAAHSALSWCWWLLGYPERADGAREQAIARAEEVGHPQTLAFALGWAAGFRGVIEPDLEKLPPLLARLDALIEEKGFQHWLAYSRFAKAKLLTEQCSFAQARNAIREGFAALEASSCVIGTPSCKSVLVSLCLAEGAIDEGLSVADDALSLVHRTEERWAEPELLRLRGELLLRKGQLDQGGACLESALDSSRRQQSRALELLAATSLARMLGEQGSRREARELLQPVYDWFTEGRATRPHRRAASLLEQLR